MPWPRVSCACITALFGPSGSGKTSVVNAIAGLLRPARGAIVVGGLDGYLYVLDGASGKLLWKFDTAIAYQGINGTPGKGGAIDSASISAGDGFLFVNSGYNMFGQTPGNVFLAFRPRRG